MNMFFFSLAVSCSMICPSLSVCGGGAGSGWSMDVLSATWLVVCFEEVPAKPGRSLEANGGSFELPLLLLLV